jgi:signal transduction histidine kinase
VSLTVDDDGGPPHRTGRSGGHGLPGMAERAALYGGTLSAGPRPDGTGWRVTAELPLALADVEPTALAR